MYVEAQWFGAGWFVEHDSCVYSYLTDFYHQSAWLFASESYFSIDVGIKGYIDVFALYLESLSVDNFNQIGSPVYIHFLM